MAKQPTITGRMPPERDQLQNIPLRTDIGRALRDAFWARRGQAFVNIDFAEAEIRAAALIELGDSK